MDGRSGQGGRDAGRTPLLGRNFVLASLAYFFVFMAGAVFYLFPLHLEHFGASRRAWVSSWDPQRHRHHGAPLFGRLLDERGAGGGARGRAADDVDPRLRLIASAGWPVLLLRALNGIGWGWRPPPSRASAPNAPPERMAHYSASSARPGSWRGRPGRPWRRTWCGVSTSMPCCGLVMLAATALCVRCACPRPGALTRAQRFLPDRSLAGGARHRRHAGGPRRPGSVVNFIALYASSVTGRIGPSSSPSRWRPSSPGWGSGTFDRYGRKRVILLGS